VKICENNDCTNEATHAIIFIDDPSETLLVCEECKVSICDLHENGQQGILDVFELH
jgi:hypothetical protein